MKTIHKFFKKVFSVFTKDFWLQEFPDIYNDECLMCNEGTCEGCSLL
ncbi:MAG: hypothetical protein ACFFG0_04160 [Candidatus Thorarchaeota archaeon]